MKFNHTDTLKIIWGDGIRTARPANGWDGLTTDPDISHYKKRLETKGKIYG